MCSHHLHKCVSVAIKEYYNDQIKQHHKKDTFSPENDDFFTGQALFSSFTTARRSLMWRKLYLWTMILL